MSKTKMSIQRDKFLINDALTYGEIEGCKYKGLLMNARFIQGIFDESENVERFNRFGKVFNPETNTEDLIQALPQWYEKGLRAITVGLQGGGPCFTVKNDSMTNHPYILKEGKIIIDDAYKSRLIKLISAADDMGMVVIVSCFYPGQVGNFGDASEIVGAVEAVCDVIMDNSFDNCILEICNEYNLCRKNPLIGTEEGMSGLITLAQNYTKGKLPVGSSLTGGCFDKMVTKVSDVVIIHGNGCSQQQYYRLIEQVKELAGDKPILCNEDSQAIGNMMVSLELGVSWGYYNNMTKQEPPTDWTITEGEDAFFARRMADELGILGDKPKADTYEEQTKEDLYFLQGVYNKQTANDERWIRLASLYPETIKYVDFFQNGAKIFRCYDDPFLLNYHWNWRQFGLKVTKGDVINVEINLVDGRIITKEKTVV